MPPVNYGRPTALERVIGGICYLTLGLAGLLFIIISGRRGQSQFFRFHFLQSIVVGIIILLVGWTSGVLLSIVAGLLGMLSPVLGGNGPAVTAWIGWGVDLVLKALNLLVLYGMIWAFLGKYAEIPFISDIVRRQM